MNSMKIQESKTDLVNEVSLNAVVVKERPICVDDLLRCMQRPLLIALSICLVPLHGIWYRNVHPKQVSFRILSPVTWCQLLMMTLLSVNFCAHVYTFAVYLKNHKGVGTGEITNVGSGLLFHGVGLSCHFFYFFRSAKIAKLFVLWNETISHLHDYGFDENLSRDLLIITVAVLGSCVGENIFFHLFMDRSLRVPFTDSSDFWQHIQRMVPGRDMALTSLLEGDTWRLLLTLFIDKITLLSWNMSDIILMLISRALYQRFSLIANYIDELEKKTIIVHFGKISNWKRIREHHLHVMDLVKAMNDVFSPIIAIAYGMNIFFACKQMFYGIMPGDDDDPIVLTYHIWSFLHLIGRLIAISLLAARIQEEAVRPLPFLQRSSPIDYCVDIKRFERQLTSRPIGLTGMGMFVITKPFLLVMTSAIFTFEVVLIQFRSSST